MTLFYCEERDQTQYVPQPWLDEVAVMLSLIGSHSPQWCILYAASLIDCLLMNLYSFIDLLDLECFICPYVSILSICYQYRIFLACTLPFIPAIDLTCFIYRVVFDVVSCLVYLSIYISI